MPKTFDILKKRWPEVAFIVFLGAMPNLISTIIIHVYQRMATSGDMDTHNWQQLMWAIPVISLIISVLFIFFQAGFLRTACLYGKQKQGLWTLFKTGAPFFIQFFIILFISRLIMSGVNYIVGFAVNQVGIESFRSHLWVLMLVQGVLVIALLKLWLFIPSLIIVRRLNIITAFKSLKHYRLLAAKETLILYAISFIVGLTGSFLFKFIPGFYLAHPIDKCILHFITELFSLAIMLSAVRFIADNTETASEIMGEQVE